MAFGRARRHVLEAEVNITPLVDVILNVLIFLALSTTFASRSGIDIRLPESGQQTEAAPSHPLEIELTREGALYVDGSPVDLPGLGRRLEGESDKDRAIVLRADKEAHHGNVVEILDAVRMAGFKKLSVDAESRSP